MTLGASLKKFHVEGKNEHQRTAKLIADMSFDKNELIDAIVYTIAQKSYQTLQIDTDKHVQLTNDFVYLNHSCQPTVYFKDDAFCANTDIKMGDELTFFYPATEWELQEPFTCHCHHLNCIGVVKGSKYLSTDKLQQYTIAKHIMDLKNKED